MVSCNLVYVHMVRNAIMKAIKAQFLYKFLFSKKYVIVEGVLKFDVCAI